ncbi:hypothetical protein [Pseudomonas sp. NPDC089406]|uniref:hypothetical protein n=1 Tax=Pseudomonas sp. NPDC089406 TaxID=3364463 RepID=UPI00384B0E22
MLPQKPVLDSDKELWNDYAELCGNRLISELRPFLKENFGYSDRHINRHLNLGLTATINAYTLKYDIYLRLFPAPEAGWPRETLIIARIGFHRPRKGYGRKLLSLICEQSAELGYQHIAIESPNENSTAFGQRFGLKVMENGRNLLGSVEDVKRALGQAA